MDIEDIRKNAKVLIDNVPYRVEENDFMKPGKGQAVYRLKLRNLLDNSILNRTFRSGDSLKDAVMETLKEQFLYHEGDQYTFMNTENFEQNTIDAKKLGDSKNYLKEGIEVTVLMMGEQALEVTLPINVDLKVIKSDAASRSHTITAQNKSAVLETGYTADVPIFVQEGDIIKIDTRTGLYVERVTKK
jgi:elongation factor P